MTSIFKKHHALGLGQKLAVANFVLVSIVLAVLIGLIGFFVSKNIEHRAEDELNQHIHMMVSFLEATDADLYRRAEFLGQSFAHNFSGKFEVSGEKMLVKDRQVPILSANGNIINLNYQVVDKFTQSTGAIATVFVKDGNDFVRVTTSLKNESGERAVGTVLDTTHPGYQKVQSGNSYMGIATLFGRRYMTRYDPIKDANGNVLGISFIGLDFSEFFANMKESIKKLKVGASGYYYILDSKPGKNMGTLVVHPVLEGKNLLDTQDADGQFFIREMLEKKNGIQYYNWMNPGSDETHPRRKLIAYAHHANWDWVIAASTYVEEYTAQAHQLIFRFAMLGLLAVALLAGAWFVFIRRMIVQPIQQACGVAQTLAAGDLSGHLTASRHDEIGDLLHAMNSIGEGLTRVVTTVRTGSESVALASAEIAQGNQDLSTRTASQASALEQTAASMEELGSTVKVNADHSATANHLAQGASQVVVDSGQVVQQVVQTMKGIEASSHRIAEIISVIDGIAFQTNILALNAAVEAARAGEQGRGFAVVASEVRALAGRSAHAAQEIKDLISHSVGEIQQGGVLVEKAGHTMQLAIEEIQKVASLMQEISNASHEQNAGVQQVGEAIIHMDQSTQQNAALVEEMASAANSLRQQASDLVKTVSVFKLAAHHSNP